MKRILFGILLASMAVFSVSAAIEIYEFETAEQEESFKKLGKELRCPKCQNNNIADSNAGLAQDLRMKVYELLKQQKNEDEIVDYMVARYGNFVTYSPRVTASTFILWLAPILVVIGGFAVLAWRSRKPTFQRSAPALESDEQVRLAQLLSEIPAPKKNEDSNG